MSCSARSGIPHHAADRNALRQQSTPLKQQHHSSISTRFETPRTPIQNKRLGPVESVTQSHQKASDRDFLEARKRRQMRFAKRLERQPKPTFFINGINPFEATNVPEAIVRMRREVARRFDANDVRFRSELETNKKMIEKEREDVRKAARMLVFRKEEENEADDEGEQEEEEEGTRMEWEPSE